MRVSFQEGAFQLLLSVCYNYLLELILSQTSEETSMLNEVEELRPCVRNAQGDYGMNTIYLGRLRDHYLKKSPMTTDADDQFFGTFVLAYISYNGASVHLSREWLPHVRVAYDSYLKTGALPDYLLRTYELTCEPRAVQPAQ